MSASSVEGILSESNNLYIFKRQLMWVGVGTVALLVAMKVPYTFFRRLAFPLLLGLGWILACRRSRWGNERRGGTMASDRLGERPAV